MGALTRSFSMGESSSSFSSVDSAAIRVLLVEDNDDVAESMIVLLGLKGHAVARVHGGTEALDYVRRFDPVVVLLDIGLPDMDGLELALQLRALPRGQEKLLIALSGLAPPEIGKALASAGVDAYFIKPADMDELSRLIADYLASRQFGALGR